MISILVTGATTPLGEMLVKSLLSDPRVRHVLAVGLEEPELLPDLTGECRCTRLSIDLTRSRLVRQLLYGPARDLEVEVVVHLAQHRRVHDRGRRVHRQNVEVLREMLELAEGHPSIRRFILKSDADIYKVSLDLPVLIAEDHPVNLSADTPQYIRDRVEADLTACARMGSGSCEIVVLRCAEALAAGTGSQLFDYLDAPVVLRPAGFDPMVNVASVADQADALHKAIFGVSHGVFNIPGYDTLPLSECVRKWGTLSIPMPGPLISRLYRLRHDLTGSDFLYRMNRRRLHYGLVLDGTKARERLGYVPGHPVDWPSGGPRRSSALDREALEASRRLNAE